MPNAVVINYTLFLYKNVLLEARKKQKDNFLSLFAILSYTFSSGNFK